MKFGQTQIFRPILDGIEFGQTQIHIFNNFIAITFLFVQFIVHDDAPRPVHAATDGAQGPRLCYGTQALGTNGLSHFQAQQDDVM